NNVTGSSLRPEPSFIASLRKWSYLCFLQLASFFAIAGRKIRFNHWFDVGEAAMEVDGD
ncbi:unnamed protein product, partial [Linum tenue]